MSGDLLDIDSVEAPGPEPSITDMLDVLGGIIRSWRVDECVSVDEGRVVGGAETYWALYKLGARYIPVGKCDASLDELGIFHDLEEYRGAVYTSTLDLMKAGKPTPLVRLRWSPSPGVRVWAKLEWYNPFSLSIKDRPALHIALKAFRAGAKSLYDASSSNFAVALAAVSRVMGLGSRVYLPRPARGGFGEVASRIMGAEVVVGDEELAPLLSGRAARDAAADGALHVNQFVNDYNFEAHLRGIAREVDYQRLRAGLDLVGVVGGIGTSGHMSALAFYMDNRLGGVDVVLAQPAEGHLIPGIRRVETGMKWLGLVGVGYSLYDVRLESAAEALREVALRDGILLGLSGAAAAAALKEHCGRGLCREGDYVMVVPDTGFKYINVLRGLLEAS